MCTEVFTADGRHIGNCGELRRELNVQLIAVVCDGYPVPQNSDGQCLCGVDMESTLKSAGRQFTRDDIGDFYLEE